ncbi:protein transport protein S31 [Tulasnella sp. 419]|nr:protein transport protein S31 [Tulasnella sp. 419]
MGGGVAAPEQGPGPVVGAGGVGVRFNALPQHVLVPHHSYAADSSVAATIGSRPSSAASDSALKSNTFKIYPNEESEVDKLVTQALVLGDFQSAVELCLSAERYADAILLAVKGGDDLLKRTQEKYFEKRTEELPYLRLYQSIVTDDLADVVQNAELREWREIFVILCTFAKGDEFSNLAKQLGQRLEFQGKVVKAAAGNGSLESAKAWRRNAVLCYLAAGKLEQIVSIWVEEMKEDEEDIIASQGESEGKSTGSRYTAHASALQTFIEKITVFRAATKYADPDLTSTTTDSGAPRSYKLAGLYDRYFEYADLLAAQGLLKDAVRFIKLTPNDYKGSKGVDVQGGEVDFEIARNRVLLAAGLAIASQTPSKTAIGGAAPAPTTVQPRTHQYQPLAPQTSSAYGPYGVTPAAPSHVAPVPAPTQSQHKPSPYQTAYAPANGSTAPVHDPYAPAGGAASQPAHPQQQQAYRPPTQAYGGPTQYGGYGGGPSPYAPAQQPSYGQAPIPPPPAPVAPPLRAPPKRTDEGWNDTPVLDTGRKGTPSAPSSSTPAAITSPFPNAQPSQMSPSSPYGSQGGPLPPPPRAGSAFGHQSAIHPPPPRGGSAMGQVPPPPPPAHRGPPPPGVSGRIPPPHQGGPPSFSRPHSTGPGAPGATFPVRSMSPLSRAGGGYPPPPGPQNPQGRPYTAGPGGPPPPGQPPRGPGPAGGPPPPPPAGSQMRGPAPGPPGPPGPPGRAPGPYGPGPGQPQQMHPQQQPQGGPYNGPGPAQPQYAPPPGGMSRPPPPAGPPQGQSPLGGPPAQLQSPGAATSSRPAPPPGPAAPKYPPGDRSHIPDSVRPAYNVLLDALARLKQTTPPQQKRMADDTERRINALFDALNCETLSQGVQDQLLALTAAMARGDQQGALALHVDLLTKGSRTDDIGLWMAGIKLLIMRM